MNTVLITGATGAIGHAIAERIAAEPGHEVVLVCRDAGRGGAAADRAGIEALYEACQGYG